MDLLKEFEKEIKEESSMGLLNDYTAIIIGGIVGLFLAWIFYF